MKLFTRMADAPPMVPVGDFNTVSQLGHFGAGSAVIFGSTLLFGPHAMWISFVFVVVLVGIKEAFIDPMTESPLVAGSGLEDFGFWVLGASVAVALIFVSRHVWLAWSRFCNAV